MFRISLLLHLLSHIQQTVYMKPVNMSPHQFSQNKKNTHYTRYTLYSLYTMHQQLLLPVRKDQLIYKTAKSRVVNFLDI